jgi:hypothetical protein
MREEEGTLQVGTVGGTVGVRPVQTEPKNHGEDTQGHAEQLVSLWNWTTVWNVQDFEEGQLWWPVYNRPHSTGFFFWFFPTAFRFRGVDPFCGWLSM